MRNKICKGIHRKYFLEIYIIPCTAMQNDITAII